MSSTKDCTDFIAKMSKSLGLDKSEKWARRKKYNSNSLVLREFENQEGRCLTIAPDNNYLFLYSMDTPPVAAPATSSKGELYLGRDAQVQDVLEFISNCVKIDSDIVYNEDQDYEDGCQPSSWKISETWSGEELSNFYKDQGQELELMYRDSEGYPVALERKDIRKIYWVFMPAYDTDYKFYIYETKSKFLVLGQNNSD